jgi:hypothetical protein
VHCQHSYVPDLWLSLPQFAEFSAHLPRTAPPITPLLPENFSRRGEKIYTHAKKQLQFEKSMLE